MTVKANGALSSIHEDLKDLHKGQSEVKEDVRELAHSVKNLSITIEKETLAKQKVFDGLTLAIKELTAELKHTNENADTNVKSIIAITSSMMPIRVVLFGMLIFGSALGLTLGVKEGAEKITTNLIEQTIP